MSTVWSMHLQSNQPQSLIAGSNINAHRVTSVPVLFHVLTALHSAATVAASLGSGWQAAENQASGVHCSCRKLSFGREVSAAFEA